MTGEFLSVSDLQVSYGDMTVLRDVDLSVPEGGVVSVVGANGAGKTTLMKTIAGVKAPDSGSITFRGESAVGLAPHELIQQGLTYVPERHTVFPEMTVLENLQTAMVPVTDSSPDVLERVFDLFPILDERRQQDAGTMSGGQQQMLAIAQGLVVEPDLILLDEPTLGLAPKIVEDVRDTILEISDEGVTVLLVDEKIQLSKEVADELYLMRKSTLQYLGERGKFEAEYERILQETIN
ncbi:ABC transporter ATP-binding protein [Halobacterium sp. KA-6]|jgi:branched-chain amino acid transport system ATP-binding protein|uniref:ABC transporter ATP-binding protein n=1 Tax=Halobacterium sp. KA-6 TaxID=2896368 RepID=UPI001E5E0E8B|nr:ABC transporter ATP-binding protein [Halobacterium sp. KA-6]MCD2203386.1 ABC transporter ATP-binding protein [Halobacterium sp. KA-6]